MNSLQDKIRQMRLHKKESDPIVAAPPLPLNRCPARQEKKERRAFLFACCCY